MSASGDGDAGQPGAAVSYDYVTDYKSSGSHKPPMFNGDPDTFSW